MSRTLNATPTVPLLYGAEMPLIGLGTYQLNGTECTRIVREALRVGYRHIDTAHYYGNHTDIARALQGFPREELFLTSKLSVHLVDPNHVTRSVTRLCDLTLQELRTDYLDLYLIHFPEQDKPLKAILHAMHDLIGREKVRMIGVCNSNTHFLKDFLSYGIPLCVNQVEFHPYLYQKELLALCKQHSIQLTSHRSLGKGALTQDPTFDTIASHHNKTPAQVLLRWLTQKNIPVIPKTTSPEHLLDNLDNLSFTLTPDEMALLDSLPTQKRLCMADWPGFKY